MYKLQLIVHDQSHTLRQQWPQAWTNITFVKGPKQRAVHVYVNIFKQRIEEKTIPGSRFQIYKDNVTEHNPNKIYI
jgi:hypothetical protein